jgi:hypothetical protein
MTRVTARPNARRRHPGTGFVFLMATTTLAQPSAASEQVPELAMVMDLAPSPLAISFYDVALRMRPDRTALDLTVVCTLENRGTTDAAEAVLDLLARERFYGMRVAIAGARREVGGGWRVQSCGRAANPTPLAPANEGTAKAPLETRVSLSPPLPAGSSTRLALEYSLTHDDPKREDLPYRIVAALPNGRAEVALITDYTWLPRLAGDSERERELSARNFFSRQLPPHWRMAVTAPAGVEAVVLDGRLESSETTERGTRSSWRSRVPGWPQVVLGDFDRVEVRAEGGRAVFVVPPDAYDPKVVEATGRLLLRAREFFSRLYGPIAEGDIQVAASSAGIGGHGAYLGMTLDASVFRRKLPADEFAPDRYFHETVVHELAHSWWGDTVLSYGRGTKFLRESLANFSAWHMGRELFGLETFQENLASLFRHGIAGDAMFGPGGDSQRLAYDKGPFVLEMLRVELGDEAFFAALRAFVARHRHSAATFADFVSVVNDVSRRDWTPFLSHWCYGEGFPVYRLVSIASERAADGFETQITIRNEGKGQVRCPLELRTTDGTETVDFAASGGESRVFRFRTRARVVEAVIDPKHSAFQGDEQETLLKSLAIARPTGEWPRYWKALALDRTGETREAIRLISESIAIHEQSLGAGKANPAFYFSRGIARARAGEKTEATEDLRAFFDNCVSLGRVMPAPLDGLASGLARSGVLKGPSAAAARDQLQRVVDGVAGEPVPLDPKLEGLETWWRERRGAFQPGPGLDTLSPGGNR